MRKLIMLISISMLFQNLIAEDLITDKHKLISRINASVDGDESPLKIASKELKKDKEVVLLAAKKDIAALEYADESLKKNKEFVISFVNISGIAIKYADESLQRDQEVLALALKVEPSIQEFDTNKNGIVEQEESDNMITSFLLEALDKSSRGVTEAQKEIAGSQKETDREIERAEKELERKEKELERKEKELERLKKESKQIKEATETLRTFNKSF